MSEYERGRQDERTAILAALIKRAAELGYDEDETWTVGWGYLNRLVADLLGWTSRD